MATNQLGWGRIGAVGQGKLARSMKQQHKKLTNKTEKTLCPTHTHTQTHTHTEVGELLAQSEQVRWSDGVTEKSQVE